MTIERRLFLGSGLALAAASGARAAEPAATFTMVSIALYLPENAMVERGPPVEPLVAYFKALVAAADAVLAAGPPQPGATGALVVALKPPARSRVWLMVGDVARTGAFTSALKGPLEAVPAPAVNGYNAFAINFTAWGGGAPLPRSPMPLPIPDEWLKAMTGDGGVLPDSVLKVLWPD
jgi:hypothetical protein